jgi:hypothetical protein
MRVNIEPYWKKLANWYWDTLDGKTVYESGMSIWDMIEHDYGARKVYHGTRGGKLGLKNQMIVEFPDEQTYTLFVLKWA